MIIEIALPIILILIMFSLGLGLRWTDFWLVLAQPKAFWIGVFNQMLMVPVVAFALAKLFGLPEQLALGLMILSACPGGLLSNSATRLAEGNVPLSIALTALISLVSTLTLPLVVVLSVSHFLGAEAPEVDVTPLGIKIFLLTTVPVSLGMLVTYCFPKFVAAASSSISRLAFWLFLVTILAALIENWNVFVVHVWSLGPVLIALNAILLALGTVTARAMGLEMRDVTTIAIESGTQNGALGITVGLIVAGAGAAGGMPDTILPAIIYSITAWILTMPYVLTRRRLALRLQPASL